MAVATYKGFSTVNNTFGTVKLTDTDLIKRDLLNHFAIRKGEKLMNGNFGTSLRDLIMDPLTEQTKQVIVQEVNDVIDNDPRVVPENVLIDEFDKGILIEMTLRYQITNQVETLQIRFDRSDDTIS
jgi:phage baseplate assembly protein W